MAELNERLAADPVLASELTSCVERYVAQRDAIEPLGASGHPGGGPEHVKCLHAHVANHLMTGDNPAGAAALEALAWTDPIKPCVLLP